jgi:hypothetical protein
VCERSCTKEKSVEEKKSATSHVRLFSLLSSTIDLSDNLFSRKPKQSSVSRFLRALIVTTYLYTVVKKISLPFLCFAISENKKKKENFYVITSVDGKFVNQWLSRGKIVLLSLFKRST